MFIKVLLCLCLAYVADAQFRPSGARGGGGGGFGGMLQQNCPSWGRWEESQCFWPTMSFDQIPETCMQMPELQGAPDFLQRYKDGVMKQSYEQVQSTFQERGNPPPCGYCSRKFRCRVRQYRPGMEIDEENCPSKEKEHTNDECPGTQVCSMSVQDGGCPNPMEAMKEGKGGKGKKGHGGPHKGGMGGPRGPGGMDPEMIQKEIEELMKKMNDSRGPAEHWNCIKDRNGNRCLCCCGHYFPDPESEQCRSAKDFFDQKLQQKIQEMQMMMRQAQMNPRSNQIGGGGFGGGEYNQDPYGPQQQRSGFSDPYAPSNNYNSQQYGQNNQGQGQDQGMPYDPYNTDPYNNDPYSSSYQQSSGSYNGANMNSFGRNDNSLGMDTNGGNNNGRYQPSVSAYSNYPQRKDQGRQTLNVPFIPSTIKDQLKMNNNG